MKRTIKALIVTICFLGLCLVGAGCTSAHSQFLEACRAVSACAPVLSAPVTVDLICDHSAGSTCNRESLTTNVDVVLTHIGDHPGSLVRLWSQGRTVDDTVLVGTREVPPLKNGSRKARHGAAIRFVQEARPFLLKASEPMFGDAAFHTSPIAETISRVALSSSRPGQNRVIVIITDGREFSPTLGDFECKVIPDKTVFRHQLDKHRLLMANTLANTHVVFANVTIGPIENGRCAATLERAATIQDLWQSSLAEASAASVTFTTGDITAVDLPRLAGKGDGE